MRSALLVVALLFSTVSSSQSIEVGTHFGMTRISSSGESVTAIQAPGGFFGLFSLPTVYLTLFPTPPSPSANQTILRS